MMALSNYVRLSPKTAMNEGNLFFRISMSINIEESWLTVKANIKKIKKFKLFSSAKDIIPNLSF